MNKTRQQQTLPTAHEWRELLRRQKLRALAESASAEDVSALCRLMELHRRLKKREHRNP